MRTPTAVSNASSSFEILPDFLLFGRNFFVDLVVDIDEDAHDSLSLSDAFSKSDKELSSASSICCVCYKKYIFLCSRFHKLKKSRLESAKNLKKNGTFQIAQEHLTVSIFK